MCGIAGRLNLRSGAPGDPEVLPVAVADPPKQGFGRPIGRWVRWERRDLAHDVLLVRVS